MAANSFNALPFSLACAAAAAAFCLLFRACAAAAICRSRTVDASDLESSATVFFAGGMSEVEEGVLSGRWWLLMGFAQTKNRPRSMPGECEERSRTCSCRSMQMCSSERSEPRHRLRLSTARAQFGCHRARPQISVTSFPGCQGSRSRNYWLHVRAGACRTAGEAAAVPPTLSEENRAPEANNVRYHVLR